jgi:hypothetical protein
MDFQEIGSKYGGIRVLGWVLLVEESHSRCLGRRWLASVDCFVFFVYSFGGDLPSVPKGLEPARTPPLNSRRDFEGGN